MTYKKFANYEDFFFKVVDMTMDIEYTQHRPYNIH